jgi:hypothetical protein
VAVGAHGLAVTYRRDPDEQGGWLVECNGLPLCRDIADQDTAIQMALAYRVLLHPGFDEGDKLYARHLLRTSVTDATCEAIDAAAAR